jgi:hypothetical protein
MLFGLAFCTRSRHADDMASPDDQHTAVDEAVARSRQLASDVGRAKERLRKLAGEIAETERHVASSSTLRR